MKTDISSSIKLPKVTAFSFSYVCIYAFIPCCSFFQICIKKYCVFQTIGADDSSDFYFSDIIVKR